MTFRRVRSATLGMVVFVVDGACNGVMDREIAREEVREQENVRLEGIMFLQSLDSCHLGRGATRHGEASRGDSCATGGHEDPATSCQGFLRRIPRAGGDIVAD
ncbi:hypothetical protein ANTRET_LOCUS3075 [Anthophora retusa]